MTDLQSCSECGWCCEFPNSHIEYCGGGGCKYIRNKYDVWFSEDGELEWKLKVKTPKQKNRLDHLPYDCLQYILQFCGDHIQFDFKKNVISSAPFQSKLKEKYLLTEYPDEGEGDVMDDYHKKNEYYLCKYLFNNYPVSSFSFERDDYDNYIVEVDYRKLGLQKKYVKKIVKPDSEVEWNKEAIEFNKRTEAKKKADSMVVHYTRVCYSKEIEFKTEEELIDDVREKIEEDDHILYLTTGIIWDNVYKRQKEKMTIGDIEALQANEHASVLKAICDVDGVIEDVIRYDGYCDFLGHRNCDNIYDDVYLVEREH